MTDLDRLQGTWHVASFEMDGQPMPAPPGARIVIEGDRFQSLGMGAVYQGSVSVDATARPCRFDLVFTDGAEEGNRSLGIYELTGDTWKICLTVTGNSRPAGFATAPGSGHALETLTRGGPVTTTEPPPASVTTGDSGTELDGEWQMTACSADGQSVPDSIVQTGRRIARNGRTSSWLGKQLLLQARYSIDATAEPHTIDYELESGGRQSGIWKFEDSTLHIVFAPPGKPRPRDFIARAGQSHTFTAWKRLK